MGNLCAFYEKPLPSPRHLKYGVEDAPTPFFNLQSAYNPRWFMGFGPNNPKGLKRHGLRFSPQGHALSLPRRMGRPANDRRIRPRDRCDFRFYAGKFKPATPSSSWEGMLKKIELHEKNSASLQNSLNSVSEGGHFRGQKRSFRGQKTNGGALKQKKHRGRPKMKKYLKLSKRISTP